MVHTIQRKYPSNKNTNTIMKCKKVAELILWIFDTSVKMILIRKEKVVKITINRQEWSYGPLCVNIGL